ncbi:helix-turn-helix transcriptional regulator [Carnobacteriaceae bacterium zg-ZUI252]|nr:helix-turn-helix transcriptional regulator [Carnobacteriaceae bacterium zg-ZUI252]MBS4769936.1 helix-turn-helix transcriptional regulator [Carnobacteriaceae bacterium zg-ZUI240]QTU83604.1 helix-turn-helix transcriptional regulator [Carnobacteriaceae bacterium zg-C25]
MAQVHVDLNESDDLIFAFEILGKKWNAVIIDVLYQTDCRFSEIASAITGISDRVLTVRLQELEQEQIIMKSTHNFGKAKFTYKLTKKGFELAKEVQNIKKWSSRWRKDNDGNVN